MRLPRWFARPGRECTISRLMPLVNATVVTETRNLRIPAGVEATHLASSAMRGCEGKVALVAEGTAPEHRPWWFVKFPRCEISQSSNHQFGARPISFFHLGAPCKRSPSSSIDVWYCALHPVDPGTLWRSGSSACCWCGRVPSSGRDSSGQFDLFFVRLYNMA